MTAMHIREILARIDEYQAQGGLKDRSLSVAATDSPDTIRNWRRALKRGDEGFLPTLSTIKRIEGVVGRSLTGDADGDTSGMAEAVAARPLAQNEVRLVISSRGAEIHACVDREGLRKLRDQLDLIERLLET